MTTRSAKTRSSVKTRSCVLAAALCATALVPLTAQPATASAVPRPALPPPTALTTYGTFVGDDGRTVVRLTREELRKVSGTTHPDGAVDAGGLVQQWRVNWGIVTGTIYFNKRETSYLRTASAVAAFANLLPPPFGTLIAINAARIALTSAGAVYRGRCLQVKTNAYVGTYTGAWCSGSY